MEIRYFSCRGGTERLAAKYLELYAALDQAMGEVRGGTDVPGLRLDFNLGLRLEVPEGRWRVVAGNLDTGETYLDMEASSVRFVSMEKYFIPWHVEVWLDGACLFSHDFEPEGRQVHFLFQETMGDALAIFPYVEAYRCLRHCQVSCRPPRVLEDLCQRCYPEWELRTEPEEDTYATFHCAVSLEKNPFTTPFDCREVPLGQVGRMILGLGRTYEGLPWQPVRRSVEGKYVCIGVQASGVAKGWLYPGGWDNIVRGLQEMGYRVLCVDKEREQQGEGITIRCPTGAEDWTGPRPLIERAELLSHAEFFIGLPSGLAWLAHGVGCPVVMLGGFSRFWHEFPGCYRVYAGDACNGCYNDTAVEYIQVSCPRYGEDGQKFSCSISITPRMVWRAIEELLLEKVDWSRNEEVNHEKG